MLKYLLTILLMVIIAPGCIDLSDPMAPSWETKLNIPVKDTLYFLEDQIKTDEYIGIDSTGNTLLYKVSSEVYQRRFSVNEYVKGQIDGVYSGYAVPFANGETRVGLPFSSGAQIDSAHIKSGSIQVQLINSTSNSAENVTVIAVGILDPNGNQLSLTTNIEANSTESISQDLTNFTYTSRNQDNNGELTLDVLLSTQNPSGEELELVITIDNSDFYYIDGVLPETQIKTIRETIELPITEDAKDFRNKVTFKDAKMEIKAIYESEKEPLFPALFENIQLVGNTIDGAVSELKRIDATDLEDQLVENGEFFKEYNTQEHNLSDFFSLVPDSVVLISDITMNPESAQNRRGIATDTDSILVEYFIEAKAEMDLDTINISSEEEFDLGDEDVTDIQNARLRYILKSELPANVEIDFTFKDENKNELFSRAVKLNSAEVTSDNYTIEAIDIDDELIFSDEEIEQLDLCEFIEYNINIYTDQENFSAWFGPKLSLDILSWAELDYFVDNSDEEN